MRGPRPNASIAIGSNAASVPGAGKAPMPMWISALVIAILVVVIPFTFILRLMLQLPKPVAFSHRRWPLAVDFGVIAVITAYTTIFIRSVYYGRATNPISILME